MFCFLSNNWPVHNISISFSCTLSADVALYDSGVVVTRFIDTQPENDDLLTEHALSFENLWAFLEF